MKAALTDVPKSGFNSHFGYHFAQADDLHDCCRKLWSKFGLSLVFQGVVDHTIREAGTTRSGAPKLQHFIRCRYTIVNSDYPADCYEIIGIGESLDTEDKGVNKALTACHKYVLMKLFDVSPGDREADPDHQSINEEHGHVSAPPRTSNPVEPAPAKTIGRKSANSLLDKLPTRGLTLKDVRSFLADRDMADRFRGMAMRPWDWPVELRDPIKELIGKTPEITEPTEIGFDLAVYRVRQVWDQSILERAEKNTLPVNQQDVPRSPEDMVRKVMADPQWGADEDTRIRKLLMMLKEKGAVVIPEGDLLPF